MTKRSLDRYTVSDRLPHEADARTYANYLGALALLGRVARKLPNDDAERDNIEKAMVDANVVLRQKGSDVYFEHASGGGYAMFDRPAPTAVRGGK